MNKQGLEVSVASEYNFVLNWQMKIQFRKQEVGIKR